MIALIPLLLFLLPTVLYLIRRRRKLRSSPSPPGPTGLPIIGNLQQFDAAAPHLYLRKLSQEYGSLIFIKLGSVPVIVVSSPEIAKQVLKTHDHSFCSRPKLLGQHKLSYKGSDVAFAPYSDSWRELRKLYFHHLLSNKQVQSLRPIREEEVFRMIRNLSLSSSSGEVCNLSAMTLDFTSTLICKIGFGNMDTEGEG